MPSDPRRLSALRQVLIQQFLLHEAAHHDLQSGRDPGRSPLIPVAHALVDIYKCLHQGEFGVGHTIDHPDGFSRRLYQEIMTTEPPGMVREPAVECISCDGRMLRVNLRGLRHLRDGDPARAAGELARVCIQSARVTRGDGTRLLESLDMFRVLNENGRIALAGHVFIFPTGNVEQFLFYIRELMRKIGGTPVFSHSETYRALNRPSYRVVEKSVLQASPLADLLKP